LQPDLLVKGRPTIRSETIVGADVVLARGGTVHIVPSGRRPVDNGGNRNVPNVRAK